MTFDGGGYTDLDEPELEDAVRAMEDAVTSGSSMAPGSSSQNTEHLAHQNLTSEDFRLIIVAELAKETGSIWNRMHCHGSQSQLGLLKSAIAIAPGSEQSDPAGYGVVACEALFIGKSLVDPTASFKTGSVPSHLGPEEYIAVQGERGSPGGYFLLRDAQGMHISATWFLNNAAFEGSKREPNIRWKILRDENQGTPQLCWEVIKKVDIREELLPVYDDQNVKRSHPLDQGGDSLEQVLTGGVLAHHGEQDAFKAQFESRRRDQIYVDYCLIEIDPARGLPLWMLDTSSGLIFKARNWGQFGNLQEQVSRKNGKDAMRQVKSCLNMTTASVGGHQTDVSIWINDTHRNSSSGCSSLEGIMNARPSNLKTQVVQPKALSDSNWLQNTGDGTKHIFSTIIVAMAHKGLQTATHRDSCGVWTWMKHLTGNALWCVWGLEDGESAQMTESAESSMQPEEFWMAKLMTVVHSRICFCTKTGTSDAGIQCGSRNPKPLESKARNSKRKFREKTAG